jgi:hypothetical protein
MPFIHFIRLEGPTKKTKGAQLSVPAIRIHQTAFDLPHRADHPLHKWIHIIVYVSIGVACR